MAHIDGYADFLVEDVRVQLGYDAKDNTHDDEVLAKLTAGEKISKSKHLKQPKYRIGQIFKDTDSDDLTFKIIFISPKVDFGGFYSYFVEITQNKGDIWYVGYDEDSIDEWLIEIK
ncbi:hypothetical protein PQE74_gp089 [Bacillus phage vB_BanS_Chewbecca]|uniref:Uncharacterized protein n=2 Tax=Tsamsavirus TaxID=3044849 RepID=A0AAE8YV25_9CAUD|nr:hypothetical protein PQE72_gp115 [Bacillus phage vB_BanS_Skywalker]YP_010681232.1 hypothetical protein PQE74_gp089 [Bacillus phage vB_BanS_Chewbecca]UGO46172.1 hypothetical protein CHEWBECCA_89 [Bacillus phage vB_BanS_Chewbecca]UGO51328.1 hypothetical protein SKYWALKER_171 [Bacillus phage vB_BanS_Skywalker]